MALTRSKPTDIFTPEGNSLAVFIDVSDGEIKLKDVTGSVTPLSTFVSVNDGVLQTPNAIDGTLQVVQDQIGNDSALEISTDEIGLKASSTATTQTTAVIQATDTNSSIAIVPNGTGAFTLQVPDGTATGGNARGQYAVDLQRVRNSYYQVASGSYSFVGNGYNNSNSGNYAFIGSGNSNQVTGSFQSIVGGISNQITSSFSTGSSIGGGNSNIINAGAGQTSCVISGGQNNTASNSHATVVGGYQNSSTGQYSISGGYSNVASGLGSVALGYDNNYYGSNGMVLGNSNTISGQNNLVSGNQNTSILGQQSLIIGRQNETTIGHAYGLVVGYYGKAYLHSQWVQSNEGFGTGSQQASSLIARKSDTLTTGATTVLFLDYLGKKIIPDGNNRVWNVTIKYTAVVTSITGTATGVSVGDCKNEVLTIGFKRIGGTSSVVGSLNTLSTNEDSSMITASFGVTAGASQEMKLDFTNATFSGGGSLTVRVVAKVELTEVGY